LKKANSGVKENNKTGFFNLRNREPRTIILNDLVTGQVNFQCSTATDIPEHSNQKFK